MTDLEYEDVEENDEEQEAEEVAHEAVRVVCLTQWTLLCCLRIHGICTEVSETAWLVDDMLDRNRVHMAGYTTLLDALRVETVVCMCQKVGLVSGFLGQKAASLCNTCVLGVSLLLDLRSA